VWKQQLPTHLDWVTIFDDVVQLISLDGAFNKQQLELAATSGSWIEPTIHRLLAIRPLALGSNRGNVLEEVCRLGTLLFLTSFWRTLGQSPVHTMTISRNLRLVLLQYKTEWYELKPLLAWTLYHAAVETADPALRSQFIFMLAVVMSGMQIQGWEEFLLIVKSVLWVDSVVAGSDDLIREEVMQILRGPPSTPAYGERFEFHEGA
jgi:myo-inositol catabolism protein IolC